ncbi:hypothetical protein HED51_12720 [Ochrobactrum grignonense]|nr:hypothetical protein [Brucella grignonensis]
MEEAQSSISQRSPTTSPFPGSSMPFRLPRPQGSMSATALRGDPDERLSALMEGTLHIPLEAAVSSIEVRPGRWLTSGFDVLPAGRYGLQRQSLRSVATVSLENRPDMIRLAHGLVVFVSQPKWSEPRNVDLRSEEEILQSAERWLSRSTAVVSLPADVRSMAPAELLRLLADRAVNEDEKADLAAVAGLLSTRSELADILPDILRRDPAFKEMLASFEESEMAWIRTQLDAQIRSETEASSARLAALRGEIAAAEAMLETFSHREALLRSETEKHEETLRSRIASAAEVIRSESSRETAAIRDEVALCGTRSHRSPPLQSLRWWPCRNSPRSAPGFFAAAHGFGRAEAEDPP